MKAYLDIEGHVREARHLRAGDGVFHRVQEEGLAANGVCGRETHRGC
jgi:hypothetical protein